MNATFLFDLTILKREIAADLIICGFDLRRKILLFQPFSKG
jgi:hypothetical protein